MFERVVIAVVIWTVIVIVGTGAMSYRCGQLDERDRWRKWRIAETGADASRKKGK